VRIVHTSDWHIGRRFERESLEADQRAFLSWLAALIESRRVDLLIVAGDIYDRAMPAEDAVTLLDEGIDLLRAAGAEIALIAGNHDSARRLGFGARRQALGGVHVFADERSRPRPLRLQIGGDEVFLLGVPYLDPALVTGVYDDDAEIPRQRSHESVLSAALELGRSAIGAPSIVIAHAFVTGAATSDSERSLAVGGADRVDAGIFDGFDYVALGHLHRPQTLGSDRIAYSGSPIPYSFSETAPKSVRLLETAGSAITSIEEIPVPVGRGVATISGTLGELLEDPAHEAIADRWVCAELSDETTQVMALERLQSRFPFATTVRYATRAQSSPTGIDLEAEDPASMPTEEIVFSFLADLRDREATEAERELVRAAVQQAERSMER